MDHGERDHGERLARVAAFLDEWRDVAGERVPDDAAPSWAARRGWEGWLRDLDGARLEAAEQGPGPAAAALAGAPPSLASLAREAAAVASLVTPLVPSPASPAPPSPATAPAPPAAIPGVPRTKSAQIEALVALCRARGFAPTRVVDVGSGAGHLTRALARALAAPALGLERDEARVARARARGEDGARFLAVAVDATSVSLARGELAVGLHACGALGDSLVQVAARDGADLVLVACCPQKIPAPRREPVSRRGRELGLGFEREVLGLANAHEGEPDLEVRAVRVALRRLLRDRGVTVRAGEESRALTPRLRRSLEVAAERALALRGLPPASEAEQREALAQARAGLGQARRLGLPRRLVAGVLEVALALDRARLLEEAGAAAEVVRLFPRSVSPRNLAVIARHGARAC